MDGFRRMESEMYCGCGFGRVPAMQGDEELQVDRMALANGSSRSTTILTSMGSAFHFYYEEINMNMPGFTADLSLSRTARIYRASASGIVEVISYVMPQLPTRPLTLVTKPSFSKCGECECDAYQCCDLTGGNCACYTCPITTPPGPFL